MNKKDVGGLVFVVILLIAIFVVNVFLYLEVKDRVKDLDQDPLQRGAEHYNLNSCSCYIDEKTTLYFNQTSTRKVSQYTPRDFDVDLDFDLDLNFSIPKL